MSVKILAVGDVCGEPGLAFLEKHLKPFRKENGIDFAVVNGAVTVGAEPTEIRSVLRTDSGATAAVACSDASASVLCAAYDASGRMLRVASQSVRAGENSYAFSLGSAASVRVFVLKNGVPLCTSYSG